MEYEYLSVGVWKQLSVICDTLLTTQYSSQCYATFFWVQDKLQTFRSSGSIQDDLKLQSSWCFTLFRPLHHQLAFRDALPFTKKHICICLSNLNNYKITSLFNTICLHSIYKTQSYRSILELPSILHQQYYSKYKYVQLLDIAYCNKLFVVHCVL